jgi:putative PIN family toxin of toxin-antitoxin system
MMISKNRFVIDTNIIISQLFWPTSIPGKAFRKALSVGKLLISEEVLQELIEVLGRKKFDPYLTVEDRRNFLHQLSFIVEIIPHVVSIKVCRDPK